MLSHPPIGRVHRDFVAAAARGSSDDRPDAFSSFANRYLPILKKKFSESSFTDVEPYLNMFRSFPASFAGLPALPQDKAGFYCYPAQLDAHLATGNAALLAGKVAATVKQLVLMAKHLEDDERRQRTEQARLHQAIGDGKACAFCMSYLAQGVKHRCGGVSTSGPLMAKAKAKLPIARPKLVLKSKAAAGRTAQTNRSPALPASNEHLSSKAPLVGAQADGSFGMGGSFRDNGQFGSYPMHEPMDDESSA